MIETELPPDELLQRLLQIEKKHGRIRGPRWGPRPLDIDIIFYADSVIETETLTVPHPRMHTRPFVLKPLLEIAPDFVHPLLKKTVSAMAGDAESAPGFRIISVVGPIGAGKSTVALELAVSLEVPFVPDPEHELAGELMRFYRDRRANALKLQTAFLQARARDLRSLAQKVKEQSAVVLDFFLDNENIFSELNVSGPEGDLYREEYEKAREGIRDPDLVIYLKAAPRTLAERVRKRSSRLSREIPLEYLEEVAEAFERYMQHYSKAPVLTYDTEACDFSEGGADMGRLIEDVKRTLGLK
jgi:deoxyadenosine/deoxycytidine kinase